MERIVLISHQAFSLVNFRGSLIKALVGANLKVYALAPDFDEETRKDLVELGAEPILYSLSRTGMNPLRDGVDTVKLALLLRSLNPDVTFAYTIKPVIFGTLAAYLARVPYRVAMIEGLGYVFTGGDGNPSKARQWLKKAVSALYRFSLLRAQKVMFLNGDDLKEFVDAKLVTEEKTVKLGGIGVDLDDWAYTLPVQNPPTFLLVARLLREKGIVEFAEAAREVKKSYPGARFVLLGGLDHNPGGLTNQEVQSWVDEGLLEWPGHVLVKPWLIQSSVYVLPSYREGVPRSTQEAMAMGRPIITTDVPGCRETVVDGENGFMVPPRDVGALVEAMLRFLEKPEIIIPMGLSSRTLAEQRFDVHKVNEKMLRWLTSAS